MSKRPGDVFTDPGAPWLGRTVYCLGSGDSLRRLAAAQWAGLVDAQRHGALVLAANSSVKTARSGGCEPDALIFTDLNWFEDNETLVRGFAGRVFTLSRGARAACDRLERIASVMRPDFARSPPLRDGRSTGHRAVSLAVMCGANYVVLLGFDMQIDPASGRSHCHDDYQQTEAARSYAEEFIPSFAGWYADAFAVGCEIVNATETTALREFPRMSLDEALAL